MPVKRIFRELAADDNVRSLSLGDQKYQPLKTFLHKQAKNLHKSSIAKTYVFVDVDDNASKPKIVAYVSLISSEIKLEGFDGNLVDDCNAAKCYDTLPAVKIARLAVDRRCQGEDLGSTLVSFSISVAQNIIMPMVGCRFIIVDSKTYATKFYEKNGFVLLNTAENKNSDHPVMFIDLHKLPTDN